LLGEVWLDAAKTPRGQSGGKPDFAAAMAVPGVRVHLYEKREARVGRKMGHLSATGATADEALARVLLAKEKLGNRD
jgi:5-(carboxyamino)imidazole ribonucleotide synthase